MDKLDMKSVNVIDKNIEKIGELFPNAVKESGNGLAIDFDALKQELSEIIVEGNKEKYQLTWPGKKEAILNWILKLGWSHKDSKFDKYHPTLTINKMIEVFSNDPVNERSVIYIKGKVDPNAPETVVKKLTPQEEKAAAKAAKKVKKVATAK